MLVENAIWATAGFFMRVRLGFSFSVFVAVDTSQREELQLGTFELWLGNAAWCAGVFQVWKKSQGQNTDWFIVHPTLVQCYKSALYSLFFHLRDETLMGHLYQSSCGSFYSCLFTMHLRSLEEMPWRCQIVRPASCMFWVTFRNVGFYVTHSTSHRSNTGVFHSFSRVWHGQDGQVVWKFHRIHALQVDLRHLFVGGAPILSFDPGWHGKYKPIQKGVECLVFMFQYRTSTRVWACCTGRASRLTIPCVIGSEQPVSLLVHCSTILAIILEQIWTLEQLQAWISDPKGGRVCWRFRAQPYPSICDSLGQPSGEGAMGWGTGHSSDRMEHLEPWKLQLGMKLVPRIEFQLQTW